MAQPQVKFGSLEPGPVPTRAKVFLCSSYALAAWAWRSWEFIVALILIELYPNSLLMVSAYGLLDNLARVILGPAVGSYVDRHERLPGARIMLRLQNGCIGGSAAAALALLWPVGRAAAQTAYYWPLMWALTLLGAASSAGSTGVSIAVEREAVAALCGGDAAALASMNATMRAIDLTALLAAPLLAGVLMTAAGPFAAAAAMAAYCALAYIPELLLLSAAFRAAPALGQPKVRNAAAAGGGGGGEGGGGGQQQQQQQRKRPAGGVAGGGLVAAPAVEDERAGLLSGGGGGGGGGGGIGGGGGGGGDGGIDGDPHTSGRVDRAASDDGGGGAGDGDGDDDGDGDRQRTERQRALTLASGSMQRPLLSTSSSRLSSSAAEVAVAAASGEVRGESVEAEALSSLLLPSPRSFARASLDIDAAAGAGGGSGGGGGGGGSQGRRGPPHSPAATAVAAPAALLGSVRQAIRNYGDSWRLYVRQPVLLPCLALALLYMTVLSLGFLMTSYLKWTGLTEAEVSAYRGVGALAGLAATALFPPLSARAGLRFCAAAGITYQLACLAAGVIPVAAEAAAAQQTAAAAGGSSGGPPSVGQVRLMVGGLVSSRTGLWLYDLAVTQLIQEHVRQDHMGSVYGVQSSLQASCEMMSFVVGLASPNPSQFHWLMLASLASVAAAAVLVWAYVCSSAADAAAAGRRRRWDSGGEAAASGGVGVAGRGGYEAAPSEERA